jgi:hypothetical protein
MEDGRFASGTNSIDVDLVFSIINRDLFGKLSNRAFAGAICSCSNTISYRYIYMCRGELTTAAKAN